MAYYPNQVYPGLQVPASVWATYDPPYPPVGNFPQIPGTQSDATAASGVQPFVRASGKSLGAPVLNVPVEIKPTR